MKPQISTQTGTEKKATEILKSLKCKFYVATPKIDSSIKYLICKETGKKIISSLTREDFNNQIISFFR